MSAKEAPLLLATRSEHKLLETREILSGAGVRIVSLVDLGLAETPEESHLEPFDTFAQNALSKARHFHSRSGLWTIADDSGLCVDALDGLPGVRTKRFAPEPMVSRWGRDEANNRYLLERLAGVPDNERGAHYHCAIAVQDDDGHAIFEGQVRGVIANAPSGGGGFGYDPVFILLEHGLTYAALPPEVKRETSHRAQALRRLLPWVEARLGSAD
jgi:XTP/dITP diphosphohydrolase